MVIKIPFTEVLFMLNKICFLIISTVLFLTGCSSSEVAKLQQSDSKEIIKIMDSHMKTGDQLSQQEQQTLDVFAKKYVEIRKDEKGKQIMDDFLDMSVALNENIVANARHNETLRQSSIDDYIKASKDFKKRLNIED
jgi:hypothetical protein